MNLNPSERLLLNILHYHILNILLCVSVISAGNKKFEGSEVEKVSSTGGPKSALTITFQLDLMFCVFVLTALDEKSAPCKNDSKTSRCAKLRADLPNSC